MHTLYGSLCSGSAAIEMALRKASLPDREVRASAWEADSAQAELRNHNPLGQVPTLLFPDGTVLTESAAILIDQADCGIAVGRKGHEALQCRRTRRRTFGQRAAGRVPQAEIEADADVPAVLKRHRPKEYP